MTREVELKLEVDPDDIPLLRQDPLLARTRSHSDTQVTVYYDTPETRLRKHGFTLRVRSAGERFVQTVKPVPDTVGLMSREEVECEVGSMKPELACLKQHPLHALLHGKAAALEPLVRSDVTRTSWRIDVRNGRMQLDLDDGTVSAGEHSHAFAELELELLDGLPSSLIIAARRLSDHVPVRLGMLSKAERGYLLARGELGKTFKGAAVRVDPGMTVGEAFEVVVHACIKHYRLNEPLVLRDCKPSALHQSRVAMRRLRSALSLFRPAVEDVEFQHLRHELRWFTAQLGRARDLDVYLDRSIDAGERPKLLEQRARAYETVIDAMNSHKVRGLMIDLVGWVAIGAWRRGHPASRPIAPFANKRLNRLWRSISGAGRDVAHMDEHTRHRLRIQVKKMRYAIEFLRGLYPHARQAEKSFADAVEELQECLGKLNDMVTARGIAKPKDDGWLIGSYEERRHLVAAEDAYRELLKTGAFWRAREAAFVELEKV